MGHYLADSDPRTAVGYFEKAENIITQLISQGVVCLEKERICAMHDAAAIALKHKAFGMVQDFLDKAVEYSQKWTEREASLDSLDALYKSQDYYGKLGLAAGYPLDAIDHFIVAKDTALRMIEMDEKNENARVNYVFVLSFLAEAESATQNTDGAIATYKSAIEFIDTDNESSAKLLAAAINLNRKVGNILWKKGNIPDASTHLQNAITISEKVILTDKSHDTMREAVLSFFSLGKFKAATGEQFGATACYLKSCTLAQENADMHNTPQSKDDLAVALCTYGEVTLNSKHISQAIEIWEELCGQYPNSNIYSQKRLYAIRALSKFSM